MGKLSHLVCSAVVLALLFSFLCADSFAQAVTTRVNGVVKDPSGAVIPGTTVKLIDNASGRGRVAVTNDEGYFVFTDVPAGYYTVTAELQGFKKAEVVGVKVDVGIPTTVNIELELGEVSETVTVEATAAQVVIHTESAELQTVVQKQQIIDLPLNGRNPIQLAGLQAGVAGNTGVRSSAVHGLRGSFTNITWDGININDNFVRTDSFFGIAAPNVESVAEFSITTQNIGPDSGLGVAQVRLVTPRGSNEYHGSLFWFHRNDVLDANSFFNNAVGLPKEKLLRNQFGFNAGGPVLKNKLFFYAYYEGFRQRSESGILRTVLTEPARRGLFTYRRRDNGQLQTVNLLALAGASIDPKMQSLIGLTPLPNDLEFGDRVNFAGFRFNSKVISDNDLWGFRFDYHLAQNHKFEAIYSRFTSDFPNDTFNDIGEPFPGRPGGGQASARPRGSFAWHWTPSQSITNELRWGFNHYDVDFVNREKFEDGFRLGFPITTNPVQNFLPQGRDVQVYELMDNLSWAKGKHLLRFGGNVRWVLSEPFNDAGIIPIFNLGFNATGNPNPLSTGMFPGGISTNDFNNASNILALLGGFIGSASQTFNVTSRDSGFVAGAGQRRDLDYFTLGFYGGDSWRIRPNLTLNFGLRWEYISVPTEKKGLALLPLGGAAALADPNAVLDFHGSGTGRPFFKRDLNNFAPSFSFAWDPFGSGKTSIRAGFSISYTIDSNLTTTQNAFNANDGLVQGVTLNNISGTVSRGGIFSIPAPQFKVPRTIADNILLDPGSALFTIDPNLRMPYVQQWTLSIEREIFPDAAFEIRYVGNHAVKLHRAIDFNQVKVRENGFLEDFLRAQRNLLNNGDPRRGEPLQVFPQLGLGGLLTNATILNLLRQGEVGELAALYVINRALFLTPGRFGARLDPSFFLLNPNSFVADLVGNNSFSNYHGLQLEVRRRWREGIYFQANYTLSKALTDFEGSQSNFSALLDNAAGRVLEKKRANFDVRHVFNANWVYELPFGPGKRFLPMGGFMGRLLGGWQIGGIWQVRSGRPLSFTSARGTLNRRARSAKNTVFTTLSLSELQKMTGDFRDSQGRPIMFDPRLIGPDGRANPDFFQNPGAGQLGLLHLTPVSGPGFFNMDINIIKRTALTETTNLEFRAEFFNIWNNVNWFISNAAENRDINSVNFGRITNTFDPRIIQFSLKLNF